MELDFVMAVWKLSNQIILYYSLLMTKENVSFHLLSILVCESWCVFLIQSILVISLLFCFLVLGITAWCFWLVHGFVKQQYFEYSSFIFVGHPSHGVKKDFLACYKPRFLWISLVEGYSGHFLNFESFLGLILIYVLYWCKHKLPIRDCSLSSWFLMESFIVIHVLVLRAF